MDSIPHKAIRDKVEAYDSHLLATDSRFRRVVVLRHEDGAYLHLPSAFLMRVEGEWIAVFTEHHGVHVYHAGDLHSYSEYDLRHDDPEEMR